MSVPKLLVVIFFLVTSKSRSSRELIANQMFTPPPNRPVVSVCVNNSFFLQHHSSLGQVSHRDSLVPVADAPLPPETHPLPPPVLTLLVLTQTGTPLFALIISPINNSFDTDWLASRRLKVPTCLPGSRSPASLPTAPLAIE